MNSHRHLLSFEIYQRAIKELNQYISHSIDNWKKSPASKLLFMEELLYNHGLNEKVLKNLNTIHVAGTKGKGTTSSIIEIIMRSYGLKTGLLTSPHIIETRERIKINGVSLSHRDFSRYYFNIFNSKNKFISDKREEMTHFNAITLLALNVFVQENVDIAILETGIGGRFDSTNVIKNPIACVLTSIDYDHMDILGNSIVEIAENKAGIIKNSSSVYTVKNQLPEVLEVIKKECVVKSARLIISEFEESDYEKYRTNLNGAHQIRNAKLSCDVCKDILDLKIEKDLPYRLNKALNSIDIMGRCHKTVYRNIKYYLDGCHTVMSFNACINWFLSEIGNNFTNKTILIFNITKNRDYKAFLKQLSVINFSEIIFTPNICGINQKYIEEECSFDFSHTDIQKKFQTYVQYSSTIFPPSTRSKICSSATETISYISSNYEKYSDNTHVLIAGSFYLVGSFLRTFME